MSEEEKKAVEILEAVRIKCDGIDVYKAIKNLLENQQKELDNLKEKYISKDKIIDLKRYYEEQAEETKIAYGKLRNISNLYRIYR